MTIESATYINQLNSSYPEGGADRSTADDHLRLIKSTVLATFPSITGPVTATQAELNLLAGATKTLASVSALTVKYSLSISANTADIARISQTVSVLWAKVTSISALNTQYSLSISALTTSLNSVSVVLQAAVASVSVVLNADLHSVSAAIQASINAVSNTVSVMAVRINTLSVSVATVQTDVARISQTVSVVIARVAAMSASVSLLTSYLPTSGTAQATTSGTALSFTGIPDWVKRITVGLTGVSTSGTSPLLIQLGDSGGIETTGYVSVANQVTATTSQASSTAGFILVYQTIAANTISGFATFVKLDGDTWVGNGVFANTDRTNAFGGSKTLSATLTQLTLTTVNGTDTFDAGSVNILYE